MKQSAFRRAVDYSIPIGWIASTSPAQVLHSVRYDGAEGKELQLYIFACFRIHYNLEKNY